MAESVAVENYVFAALNSLLAVLIILANTLTIIAIARYPALRTQSNLYVLNLAFADLMKALSLILELFLFIPETRGIFDKYQPACLALQIPVFVGCALSLLTLLGLSVDRAIFAILPVFYDRRVTMRVTIFVIAVLWLCSLAYGVLPVVDTQSDKGTGCRVPRIDNLKFSRFIVPICVLLIMIINAFIYLRTRCSFIGLRNKIHDNKSKVLVQGNLNLPMRNGDLKNDSALDSIHELDVVSIRSADDDLQDTSDMNVIQKDNMKPVQNSSGNHVAVSRNNTLNESNQNKQNPTYSQGNFSGDNQSLNNNNKNSTVNVVGVTTSTNKRIDQLTKLKEYAASKMSTNTRSNVKTLKDTSSSVSTNLSVLNPSKLLDNQSRINRLAKLKEYAASKGSFNNPSNLLTLKDKSAKGLTNLSVLNPSKLLSNQSVLSVINTNPTDMLDGGFLKLLNGDPLNNLSSNDPSKTLNINNAQNLSTEDQINKAIRPMNNSTMRPQNHNDVNKRISAIDNTTKSTGSQLKTDETTKNDATGNYSTKAGKIGMQTFDDRNNENRIKTGIGETNSLPAKPRDRVQVLMSKARLSSATSVLIINGIFFVFWLPIVVTCLAAIGISLPMELSRAVLYIAMCHAFVNVIVCLITRPDLRAAYKRILCSCCERNRT